MGCCQLSFWQPHLRLQISEDANSAHSFSYTNASQIDLWSALGQGKCRAIKSSPIMDLGALYISLNAYFIDDYPCSDMHRSCDPALTTGYANEGRPICGTIFDCSTYVQSFTSLMCAWRSYFNTSLCFCILQPCAQWQRPVNSAITSSASWGVGAPATMPHLHGCSNFVFQEQIALYGDSSAYRPHSNMHRC